MDAFHHEATKNTENEIVGGTSRPDKRMTDDGGRRSDLVLTSHLSPPFLVAEVFKPPIRLTPGFIRGKKGTHTTLTALDASASSR